MRRSASGWSRVCRSANAVELLALADAARLSDRDGRARSRRCWRCASASRARRAPRPARSRSGRLAFEKRGAYAEAARWFATYLDEQPAGPAAWVTPSAALMEARQRARATHAAARRDAERYLQRFPEGPYAGTARAILAE